MLTLSSSVSIALPVMISLSWEGAMPTNDRRPGRASILRGVHPDIPYPLPPSGAFIRLHRHERRGRG